jgi:hypothetical protein
MAINRPERWSVVDSNSYSIAGGARFATHLVGPEPDLVASARISQIIRRRTDCTRAG